MPKLPDNLPACCKECRQTVSFHFGQDGKVVSRCFVTASNVILDSEDHMSDSDFEVAETSEGLGGLKGVRFYARQALAATGPGWVIGFAKRTVC